MSVLLPDGWSIAGGLSWNFGYSPPSFAQLHLRFASPEGDALEMFPTTPFSWPPPPSPASMGLQMNFMMPMALANPFPPGSLYNGNFLYQPVDPVTFLQQHFLPKFRPASTIISQQQLPAAAEAVRLSAEEPGVQTTASAMRISLSEPNSNMREDVFVAIVYHSVYGPMGQQFFWRPHLLYSFRTTSERMERQEGLLQLIAKSAKLTPRFIVGLKQLGDMWIQAGYQRSNAALESSRIISRLNDDMIRMNRSSWEKKLASDDRISHNFSQAIRGVETWTTGSGENFELPNGYNAAWRNGNGEIVVSQSTLFDPNSEMEWGNWSRMSRVNY